jgi:flagellar basal body-associated protein FliL
MADDFDTDLDDDTEGDEEIAPKSKLPMLMMIIGLAGLGGGAYLGFAGKDPPPEDTEHTGEGEDAEAEAKAKGPGPLVDLDTFIVNLNEHAEMRYLKCKIAVETENDASALQVEAERVRVRNAVLLYLSNLTLADTAGIEQKQAIQTALAERLSETVSGIRGIYLTEFVVQ